MSASPSTASLFSTVYREKSGGKCILPFLVAKSVLLTSICPYRYKSNPMELERGGAGAESDRAPAGGPLPRGGVGSEARRRARGRAQHRGHQGPLLESRVGTELLIYLNVRG